MATLMPLCAGLVGPKSENVEISLVLQASLRGQDGPERANRTNRHPAPTGWEGVGGG